MAIKSTATAAGGTTEDTPIEGATAAVDPDVADVASEAGNVDENGLAAAVDAADACQIEGLSLSEAESACASLRGACDRHYTSCIFDFCALRGDRSVVNASLDACGSDLAEQGVPSSDVEPLDAEVAVPAVQVERTKAVEFAVPTEGTAAAEVAVPVVGTADAAAVAIDVAANYPLPTLSEKKLIDGSSNYLPVPNAESEAPDDLAWRRIAATGGSCPPGRRPYHTILTAQAGLYQESALAPTQAASCHTPGPAGPAQLLPIASRLTVAMRACVPTLQEWQTKIFYYHFRKLQKSNPCTEMTGFTRLLASAEGKGDGLMDLMPTVTVPQLGHDKTRGFMVI